jgi:hypothetical protein
VPRRVSRRIPPILILAVAVLVAGSTSLAAPIARAAGEDLEMEARGLLQGHGRAGSWMAIEVHLQNAGPSIVGELRLAAGAQGRTRFSLPVDLPTDSNKTFLLYAQPPAFGGGLDIALIAGGSAIASRKVELTVHPTSQLVIGVVAEQPQRIVPNLRLAPNSNGEAPAIVALTPEDLPSRVEAWSPIDRLIWQDVDSNRLQADQITAMRGWLAGGGRLVIAGGSAGPGVLSTFPDDILPFRPTATVDASPESLTSLLGETPRGASDIPALGGELVRGRLLANVGDRAIAAEAPLGSGVVSLIGIDPGTAWIVDGGLAQNLWRSLVPQREAGPLVLGDDNQIITAVSQLPALALPPIGGLLLLLAGYILLIGPINYAVLRKLDRREWAWVTMPVLIGVFAAGSYGFGAALRGLDVIVNEVAIVRGAPDTTEGLAQVYLGVFSPSRGTYQVKLPGGALLSSTLNGELSGNQGSLDLVQGTPSEIRNLAIGFGSLRTLRAETPAAVPRIHAELRLEGDTLKGVVRNLSDTTLEKPAVVLGGSAIVLQDLAPGKEQAIELGVHWNPVGQSLSDKIVGQVFFGDPNRASDATQRNLVRHGVIDQLACDTFTGDCTTIDAETPVLIAWGSRELLDVRIQDQLPRRTGNAMYYIPLSMRIEGPVTFEGDLMRQSLVDAGTATISGTYISLGLGEATMAYRPVAFQGTLEATSLVLSTNASDVVIGGRPLPVDPVAPACNVDVGCPPPVPAPEPTPCDAPDCPDKFFDGIPEIELFDRTGDGQWVRLPHFASDQRYEIEEPARYVDPVSGTVLVRFVNDRQDGASFTFQVRIEGRVR